VHHSRIAWYKFSLYALEITNPILPQTQAEWSDLRELREALGDTPEERSSY